MPASKQQANTNKSSKRSRSFFSLLFFWPIHLLFFLTRGVLNPYRFLLRFFGTPALLGFIVIVILSVIYGFRSSYYDLNRINQMPERSIILDCKGKEIGRIHGEKRSIFALSEISPDFIKSILAREDERFYYHPAVDILGMARAFQKNLQGKREGASTITQQLASDVFQLKKGERRGDILQQLDRKLLEIAIAFRIESKLTKDEILQAYINQINWGRQIKGVGEASRIYFEKHPIDLSLSESALLAGIVRGPDAYNPFSSLEAAERERNTTLARMVSAGEITQAQADEAKKETIIIRPVWRRDIQASYAIDAIRRDLEIILEQENIDLGGLTIKTTIDQRLQDSALIALDKKLREVERIPGYPHQTRGQWQNLPKETRSQPKYIQGSAVLIDNATGAVLALVGGRDADESPFNRAIQAKRQIGSVFKPFVYLAAFDKGMQPSTLISDSPILRGEIKGAPNWRPNNADGKFGGMHPASYGLIRSRNTMSVRVANSAGMASVKAISRAVGFGDSMPENPASYLGSWEATPWHVASSYTIFPNNGERYKPYLIKEIRDANNNVLYGQDPLLIPASISKGSVWSISKILKEVATSGTASSIKRLGFTKPAAGKTGTTNDFKDAWFAGYTSSLTCAVWVGFDQPKKTIEGGFGSTLALPVWVDIMKTADRFDDYKAGEITSKLRSSVDSAMPSPDAPPLRAQPVEEESPPLRAQPIEEDPPRAIPID